MKGRRYLPRKKYIGRSSLQFRGWGIVGEPKDGVIIAGPSGPSIDVTGYHVDDYWDGDHFRGPDHFGIVPIYHALITGAQFPPEATPYPYLA